MSVLVTLPLFLLSSLHWTASTAFAQAADPAPSVEVESDELGDAEIEEYDADEPVDTETEQDWSDIEEIRVKSRPTSSIEFDAAESAVKFDSADLDAMGAADVSDLAKVTPNLEIRQADATTANFFIRGVGLADFSANSASAVAIYQDGVPLNASAIQLVGLFDTSVVDVLRGPQGSGSGRNATAGAIRIDSRLPTGDLQAQLKSTFGTYSSGDVLDGALIMDFEGALEMPLIEDLLSTRISFRVRSADPYRVNGCGDAPPVSERVVRERFNQNIDEASICGERDTAEFPVGSVSPIPEGLPAAIGDQGNWAARGILRFQPQVLDMDWLLNFHADGLDQQSSLGQAMGTSPTLGRTTSKDYVEPDQADEFLAYFFEFGLPRDQALGLLAENLASKRPLDLQPYRGDYNRVGQTTRDSFGGSLKGSMLFESVPFVGPVEVSTISAYDRYDRFRDVDQDFTPVVLFERIQEDSAWQFFQELKASGENPEGTLRGDLGGYFLMEELGSEFLQFTISPNFDFYRTFNQDLSSFAFYGDVGWDFLDDFTLDAGIRYNWERKSFEFAQVPLAGTRPRTAIPQEETWSAPTGLLSLKYRFNDDAAAYIKYSRGWKGGHFNANRPNLPELPVEPAKPETLNAIEVGFRGSWLDNKLSMSGAFFYYKYKDYQLFLFENAQASPPILEIVNANDVEQFGLEYELSARPIQDAEWVPDELVGLELTVRFGWLESQFLDFVNLVERLDPSTFQVFQQEVNYTGNRLPNSPRFKVSGVLQWPFEFGRFGVLTPRYDFDWTDDVFFGPNEGRGTLNINDKLLPEMTIGQGAFARHNLRLSYLSPDSTIEISGWVRNITDERYKTYAFDASIFAAVVLNFVGDPRTAGVDISIRF